MRKILQPIAIALAFVGIPVGAAFASGREAVQYYVAFGSAGLVAAAAAALIVTVSAVAMMLLASLYQADDHTAVFKRIAGPWMARLMDVFTIITLFCIGFVMFAGGGSSLNQQFGAPIWVGALLILGLLLLTGLLNTEKVAAVIGAFTPFIVVFIVLAAVYTVLTTDFDAEKLNQIADDYVETTISAWWIGSINYGGINTLCSVAMAVIIGGRFFSLRIAGTGGLLGGLLFLAMLVLMVLALYLSLSPELATADLPMLVILTNIHPWLGTLLSLAIFGMILNTAIGMFYSLGKRLTKYNPRHFYAVFVGVSLVGFVLSFAGYQNLIGWVYPALGYLGIIPAVVLWIGCFKAIPLMKKEGNIRAEAMALVDSAAAEGVHVDDEQLEQLAAQSVVDDEKFLDRIYNGTDRHRIFGKQQSVGEQKDPQTKPA